MAANSYVDSSNSEDIIIRLLQGEDVLQENTIQPNELLELNVNESGTYFIISCNRMSENIRLKVNIEI